MVKTHSMTPVLFHGLDEWLIDTLLLVLLVTVAELGYRAGLRRAALVSDQSRSFVATVISSLAGMLGLLLAFTLSMAVTRFDARRLLVVQDTNAIGTTYLRAKILPEPERGNVIRILRRYVDARVEITGRGSDPRTLQPLLAVSEQLQQELWSQAVTVAAREKTPITALFLQTLNDLIDLHAERVAAAENRVPSTVVWLLCGVSLLTSLLIGYGFGLSRQRSPPLSFGFAMIVAALLLVIMDLDRPQSGLIRVSQSPMIRLRETIAREPP